MTTRYFGAPIKRNEDPRLLRGRALFVDDVVLPGMMHVAFLRSAVAHGRIRGIDATAARRRIIEANGVYSLNARLSKGITPDKNANVLIWKAIGPRPEGTSVPADYFKALGIVEPPEHGDYFVDLNSFRKDHLKIDEPNSQAVDDQYLRAMERPWSAKDCPHIAKWLTANEKPLAIVIEATKCPDYFNAMTSRRNETGPGILISALLPNVPKCRQVTGALAARAMLRIDTGEFDGAWQDLLACHRMGRLVGRGATLIEGLVGIALDRLASTADLAYCERAPLTANKIQERLRDLQSLPPVSSMADKVDLGERCVFLDSLQQIRRGVGVLESLEDRPAPKITDPKVVQAMDKIDWEPALRNANRWYDRLAVTMRLKDRAARERELKKIDLDIKALKKEHSGSATVANLLLQPNKIDKLVGKTIGDVLIGLLMPDAGKMQNAFDRSEQVQRNLFVAFALAAHRRDTGRYPAKLDDLLPRYLAEIPTDIFSGRTLTYRPAENGYLLYSVGVNGKDEEGHSPDDNPPGDDLRVRIPLPELKPKK
jgi:hypothetical protein